MAERILHLNLKKQWFDMIASGEKKEEYRNINDYWYTRLAKFNEVQEGDKIIFSNGYSKDRRQMEVELLNAICSQGNPAWGAEKGTIYFVLRLGEILKRNF